MSACKKIQESVGPYDIRGIKRRFWEKKEYTPQPILKTIDT